MDKIPNGYALVKMSLLEELDEYHDLGPISRLRELAEADKDGRCVILPCKVGDTVYVITQDRLQDMKKSSNEQPDAFLALQEHIISTIVINDSGVRAFDNSCCFYLSGFGKTVFLTRSAAEAALEAHHV